MLLCNLQSAYQPAILILESSGGILNAPPCSRALHLRLQSCTKTSTSTFRLGTYGPGRRVKGQQRVVDT